MRSHFRAVASFFGVTAREILGLFSEEEVVSLVEEMRRPKFTELPEWAFAANDNGRRTN